MRDNILILGCGLGGLSAAIRLSKLKSGAAVTVIDKCSNFTFLPLLPDLVGRGISPGHTVYPIEKLAKKHHFRFIQASVEKIDILHRQVDAGGRTIVYDYLLIALGSETDFYGDKEMSDNALRMDNAAEAVEIRRAVCCGRYENYIISGGGYTGIELATNIKLLLKKEKSDKKVMIIEKSASLLGSLPAWMSHYATVQLDKLGIDHFTYSTIEKVSGDSAFLSDGRKISGARVLWAGGVKTPDPVRELAVKKTIQGRLISDEYLRIASNVFVAGDCAAFEDLRMAVRFAIQQGRVAAENICRSIKHRELKRYRPFDWGYVVPFANNASCGIFIGFNVKGLLGIIGHYFLCFWLSCGIKNRLGLLKDLLVR